MSAVSGEVSEAELDLSWTSDVENETVCPDDNIEDKAHPQSNGEAPYTGRKVPSTWDVVTNEPNSKPESDIDLDVQGGG